MIFTAGLRFFFFRRGRKGPGRALLPLSKEKKRENRQTRVHRRGKGGEETAWGGEVQEEGVGDSVTYAFGKVDTGSANCYN